MSADLFSVRPGRSMRLSICSTVTLALRRKLYRRTVEVASSMPIPNTETSPIVGGNGELRPWCDGIPPKANAAVVEVMRTIVSQALLPGEDRKF